MNQINSNNNSSIAHVGSTKPSESTSNSAKAPAGLFALRSIVSGFNASPASPSANLAQATSVAAANLP
jgi:hypothetical protein